MMLHVLLLTVGFVFLVKGADWFVDGAAGLADRFGIPQLVIGLTIVAMGTSAPEAAVSITAALKGSAGIAVGNIVGSNILNVLIILGLTACVATLSVAKSTIRIELPYMIAISLLLLLFGWTGNEITFWEGVGLWVAFLLYLGYLFRMAKKNKETPPEEASSRPLWMLLVLSIIGLVLIVWGSDVTVDAATALARYFGMSERFIGLTIVALGTSLPELFSSLTAARKGNADIAIGNIVGSNIFNILFVLGTTALITPVPFAARFTVDTIVAVLVGVLLLVCVARSKKLTKPTGILMLAAYAAYFIYLLQV